MLRIWGFKVVRLEKTEIVRRWHMIKRLGKTESARIGHTMIHFNREQSRRVRDMLTHVLCLIHACVRYKFKTDLNCEPYLFYELFFELLSKKNLP